MGAEYGFRWSVYVNGERGPVLSSGGITNHGEGNTPAEALANLRTVWEGSKRQTDGALDALNAAIAAEKAGVA